MYRTSYNNNFFRPAMDAIASAAILESNNAKKVSKMISFSRVQLHQQKLHSVFLYALRDKVDGISSIVTFHNTFFYIYANLNLSF